MKLSWKIVVLTCVVLAFGAQAQDENGRRYGVGLDFGYWKQIGGEHDYSNVDQVLGLRVRRAIDPAWSLDLGLKAGILRPGIDTPGDDAGLEFESGSFYATRVWQPSVTAVYNLAPTARLQPWVSGGLGVTRWDVYNVHGVDMGVWPDEVATRVFDEDGTRIEGHGVNLTGILGVGVDYAISDRVSLGLSVATNLLLNQDKDTIGLSNSWGPTHVDANTQLVQAGLGVTWMFGGGQEAPAPTPPPPPPAPVKETPPPPPPAPVDPDTDGDGIRDSVDQCPDKFEDKDGFQDADGCPDPDNDGDGVLDAADRCPDTPIGVKVDASGCPVVEEIKQALILEGVNFATGKDVLDESSKLILDGVAERLAAYPKVRIEVGGHTDSTGNADKNKALSQARADAVRNYLIGKGIAGDRITAVGYGSEKPIGDNATAGGRTLNRRVEIDLLK